MPQSSLPRIAVLVSGRGSNLQALIDAIAAGTLAAEIVGVFSDRLDAAALQRVPPELCWSRDAKAYASREAFDAELADAVAARTPDWVICAGYLRILGTAFVARFRGRLLNIHPSLLPKYRGLHTHRRALEAGDAEHGASVHFVTAELDGGPVIAQARLRIEADDDELRLAERLLPLEHRLLPAVLGLLASGRLQWRDDAAHYAGQPLAAPLLLGDRGLE